MLRIILLLALLGVSLVEPAAASEQSNLARGLTWHDHFAERPGDSSLMYTLMNHGFFRAPTSSEHSALIKEWLGQHPTAIVVPVVDMGPWKDTDPNSHMIYIWVVDGLSNLNLHLLEVGDCAGPTMEVDPDDKLLLPRSEYEQFLKQAVAAHRTAVENRLGIWKESPPK